MDRSAIIYVEKRFGFRLLILLFTQSGHTCMYSIISRKINLPPIKIMS